MSIQAFDPPAGGGFPKDAAPVPELLIAVHSAGIRACLDCALRNRGYRVRFAANTREARAQLDAGVPALLVTDPQMPRGDGWRLIRYSVTHFPRLPILIFSGGSRNSGPAGGGFSNSDDILRLCAEVRRLVPLGAPGEEARGLPRDQHP